LGGDNPQKEVPSLDMSESTMNGRIEGPSTQPESMVENPPPAKGSKKVNSTAPERKRASKSKAAALAEDDTRAIDKDGDDSAGLLDGVSARILVKNFEAKKSSQEVLAPAAADPESIGNVDEETTIQDIRISSSSELPQRAKKVKKHRIREYSYEPAIKSQDNNNDSAAIVPRPLTPAPVLHTHIELDTQEDSNLAASSQLQGEAHSIAALNPINGEDAEEEPRRPSKKSLGKRKAMDEPLLQKPNKTAKRSKDNKPSGRDLRTFGFLPSDEVSNSRCESGTSHQSPTLTDLVRKVWEENNRISQEPELPYNPPTSVKSPRPSWNAINNPVEPDEGEKSSHSLFIPDQEARNASQSKRSVPVVEIWPMKSTPSVESHPTPTKSIAKTPQTPKKKENGIRTAPISKMKLSTAEFDAITSAVKSYRERYSLTETRMNDLIHANAVKDKVAQKMWKSICEEVPEIPRRNVLNTCRRTFYNFRRGPWTEEEDDELKRAHEEYDGKEGKWNLIGETLNRFPEDTRDRWRNYIVCGDTLKKDAWELEEEKRLRAAVKECIKETREKTRFSDVQVLDEGSLIEWGKVSELMGRTRSRLQCRDKWIKLKDREEITVDDPVAKMPISETWRMEVAALDARLFSAEEKLKLLQAIRDSGAAREGKIPWQTLKGDLNGKGKRMAWRYCFRRLKECVPSHEDMEFKDTVAYLVDVFETAAPKEPDGFDLPIENFPPSSITKKKKKTSRLQRATQDAEDDEDDKVAVTSSTRSGKLRDRMLKDDESQETATSQARSSSADVVEVVAQGFESIKRKPKSAGKLVIRKSKRNHLLSAERVIEDSSDDNEPLVNGNGDPMDLDNEESDDPFAAPAADHEVDNEEDIEQPGDQEYFDQRAARKVDGNWDLDTPLRGRKFKKELGSPIYLDGSERAVSSGSDISDIPARRQPRQESVEL
jgi:hypothetical protein